MRPLTKALGQASIVEDADERIGKSIDVTRVDEQPVAVVLDEIRNAAHTTAHDGPSPAEGLHDHAAHSLGPRRQDEQSRFVER